MACVDELTCAYSISDTIHQLSRVLSCLRIMVERDTVLVGRRCYTGLTLSFLDEW